MDETETVLIFVTILCTIHIYWDTYIRKNDHYIPRYHDYTKIVYDYVNYRIEEAGFRWHPRPCEVDFDSTTDECLKFRTFIDKVRSREDEGIVLEFDEFNLGKTLMACYNTIFAPEITWHRIGMMLNMASHYSIEVFKKGYDNYLATMVAEWTIQYIDDRLEEWMLQHEEETGVLIFNHADQ
jgi:hypothetical protein